MNSVRPDTPTLGLGLVASAAALLAACAPAQEPAAPPPPAPPPAQPAAAAAPAPAPTAAPQPAEPQVPPPIIVKGVGLKTPESVLYLPDEDVYLVSNVNGNPSEADGNGFISKIAPDGKVIELKWIDGEKKGVNLDGPKGMAVAGNRLYVADIKWVRLFDLKTGKPLGKIGVGGATFLNDVAPAASGKGVWLSDSGMKFGEKGAESTNTEGVFRVANMQAKRIMGGETLGFPNGVLPDETGTWVISYKTNELYHVTKDGKKEKAQKLPKGSLDGIVKANDGSILVSSWEAKAVFQGTPGGEFKEVVTGVESPADIGYDSKRHRVLIPLFTKDELQFHTLPGAPATPAASPAAAPAAQPAAPAAQPAKPGTPAKPATPATPAKAATPATPAKPAQPKTQPAKPATPATPAKK